MQRCIDQGVQRRWVILRQGCQPPVERRCGTDQERLVPCRRLSRAKLWQLPTHPCLIERRELLDPNQLTRSWISPRLPRQVLANFERLRAIRSCG